MKKQKYDLVSGAIMVLVWNLLTLVVVCFFDILDNVDFPSKVVLATGWLVGTMLCVLVLLEHISKQSDKTDEK